MVRFTITPIALKPEASVWMASHVTRLAQLLERPVQRCPFSSPGSRVAAYVFEIGRSNTLIGAPAL